VQGGSLSALAGLAQGEDALGHSVLAGSCQPDVVRLVLDSRVYAINRADCPSPGGLLDEGQTQDVKVSFGSTAGSHQRCLPSVRPELNLAVCSATIRMVLIVNQDGGGRGLTGGWA
jgi:hypothetical protein